jgi:hypothetical protein
MFLTVVLLLHYRYSGSRELIKGDASPLIVNIQQYWQ